MQELDNGGALGVSGSEIIYEAIVVVKDEDTGESATVTLTYEELLSLTKALVEYLNGEVTFG